MKSSKTDKNTHDYCVSSGQHTINIENLNSNIVKNIDQEKYSNILKEINSRWDDTDSDFDSIEAGIISAIAASPCEIFSNLCEAFYAIINDNNMKENIKTRCYWNVIHLLLCYHNFNNNYIPLYKIEDTFLQISTIIGESKKLQYNALGKIIKNLLEEDQSSLINDIATYLCDNVEYRNL